MKILKLFQPNCFNCALVENFLKDKGIEHESIDVSKELDVAEKFKIMSTPVTILLDDDGNEIQRSVGFKVEELEEIISKLN